MESKFNSSLNLKMLNYILDKIPKLYNYSHLE